MLTLGGHSVPLKTEALALAALLAQPNPSVNDRMNMLSRFNDLFLSTRIQSSPWNEVDRTILTLLLDAMIQCTSDGLMQWVDLGLDRRSEYVPINWFLQEIDYRLFNPNMGWSVEFGRLELRKAQLMRIAARASDALNVLMILQNPQQDEWLESARLHWTCSIELEFALSSGQITLDDFIRDRQTCLGLSRTLRRNHPEWGTLRKLDIEKEHYACFPNPSSGNFQIHRSQSHHPAEVHVFDLAGRVVHQSVWPAAHSVLQINREALNPGWYTLVIRSNYGSKATLKLSIE